MSVPPADGDPAAAAAAATPGVDERRRRKFSYYSQLYVIPAVDAVDAGKGQLEISVNQGRVPNNVQMQGAGRCLVTFIPQHPGTYVIDVTFNGEQVHGCPIKVEILPKQVGEVVHANLTPTAVTTAISAGKPLGPSSEFCSKCLLQHLPADASQWTAALGKLVSFRFPVRVAASCIRLLMLLAKCSWVLRDSPDNYCKCDVLRLPYRCDVRAEEGDYGRSRANETVPNDR
ncbi:unnamed protein product [Heligmosomoides polygyrus]|uniref:Filamin-A n=1 Tax=Heligmosomoides polygyrus TaxID=6339 RepID=A0A183FDA1_HELPZ|nr:unnamed protein product [Heligmosomoides polygyrus]